jgi:hypothetical protein
MTLVVWYVGQGPKNTFPLVTMTQHLLSKQVEVSCGAALASVYEKKKELLDLLGLSPPSAPVLVIVCGGNMATIEFLQHLQKELGGNKEANL